MFLHDDALSIGAQERSAPGVQLSEKEGEMNGQSAFNTDGFLLRDFPGILLGQVQMENTVLKTGLHIFLCHVLADVEGSLHGAGIAFLADHAALLACQTPCLRSRSDTRFPESVPPDPS